MHGMSRIKMLKQERGHFNDLSLQGPESLQQPLGIRFARQDGEIRIAAKLRCAV